MENVQNAPQADSPQSDNAVGSVDSIANLIGGEDKVAVAKRLLSEAKKALAIAEGKVPGRRGKPPLEFKAIQVSAQLDESKFNEFKTFHPTMTNTQLLRLALELALERMHDIAEAEAAQEAEANQGA